MTSFPSDFWWGCATSSHQVEGGTDNDWTDWERRPGAIADGTRSGDAARWWSGAAETDLERAASWGHTATRLSVEWSRLEPEPGRFDEAAFERYAKLLEHAGALGLSRLLTINHFTLPRWVARRGAWLWDDIVAAIGRFAEACAKRLGTSVERWATINEPSLVALLGYAEALWPPGHRDPRTFGPALANMLRAHVSMTRAIKAPCPNASVGLVLNMPCFDPSRDLLIDRGLAWLQDHAVSGVVLRALESGRLWPPVGLGTRIEGLQTSYDWLGLNYYGRYAVRFSPRAYEMAFGAHVQTPTSKCGETDWGQPHPQGLTRGLRRLAPLGVPLLVTENGIQTEDDAVRTAYLRSHVAAVRDALAEGIDVRGYFHWSLVDNFEWAEGWRPRFGLLALDRATGERTPRATAEVYAQICRNHGE
ncbi:MAG: glycoside hydrolase family 1 protein [Nannocystaceae bacterium]|nr:family 1 glycosylhydrolase [bacterium]